MNPKPQFEPKSPVPTADGSVTNQKEVIYHNIYIRLLEAFSLSVTRVLTMSGCWLPIGRHRCIGASSSAFGTSRQRNLKRDDADVKWKVRSPRGLLDIASSFAKTDLASL